MIIFMVNDFTRGEKDDEKRTVLINASILIR
jgi:hypothetical protein